MISAAQETFQPGTGGTQEANPFAGLFPPTSQSQQAPRVPTVPAGTENTNPLPNPWAPPTSGAPPTSTSTNTATGPTPPGGTMFLVKVMLLLCVDLSIWDNSLFS